ncbi:hypothetical protein [Peterkaempfera bronchialis]|uniref:hypothetical protein n=1 Tax=Peterkaempfera bronchialis TaxID=2126346 RepID=UPI003C2E087D
MTSATAPVIEPAADPALPVLLNPSAVHQDGRIRYQVRDGERIRVLAVTVTATVRALVALAGLGPLPAAALTAELGGRLAGPDAAAQAVRAGLRSGLLVPAGPGGPPAPPSRPGTGAAALRHTLARPPAGYERAFGDLAAVARLCAVFDRGHDTRALLTVAFTDRFGAGGRANLADEAADLLGVAQRRARMLGSAASDEFGPADGSLGGLLRLRAEARRVLDRRLRATADGPVALEPGLLEELAAGLPQRFAEPPVGYRVLVRPQDGWVEVLAYEAAGRTSDPEPGEAGQRIRVLAHPERPMVRSAAADRAPMASADWCRVALVHDEESDTLTLHDGDGRPFLVRCTPTGQPESLPAPLGVAAWLSGAGRVLLDPYAATVAGLRAADPSATGFDLPRLTSGRVVLGRGGRLPADPGAAAGAQPGSPASPVWLVDCDGAAR